VCLFVLAQELRLLQPPNCPACRNRPGRLAAGGSWRRSGPRRERARAGSPTRDRRCRPCPRSGPSSWSGRSRAARSGSCSPRRCRGGAPPSRSKHPSLNTTGRTREVRGRSPTPEEARYPGASLVLHAGSPPVASDPRCADRPALGCARVRGASAPCGPWPRGSTCGRRRRSERGLAPSR